MRSAVVVAVASIMTVALAVPASAAKTYDDPWLAGDLRQIRAPDGLDILARTPQHVIVGDVDSGARLSDPDLAPHLLRMSAPSSCDSVYGPGPTYGADPSNGDFGCDFVGSGSESTPSTDPDGDPTDPYGHGTGTAAVIAAVANNRIEGAGVAPNARVLPIRACYGGAPDCYPEPTAAALTYAVDMGATVVDVALTPDDEQGTDAIRSVVQSHPAVLFAFGTSAADPTDDPDPYTLCSDRATYPNVVCVGQANASDAAAAGGGDTRTDVSAPGYAGVPSAGGARAQIGGVGAATAHVAGAAALLRGIAPDLSASTIRQALVSTSRRVTGYDHVNRAHGIIDLAAAVRSVQQKEGLTTPAAGHGAAADSPDPFPGQTATTPAPPASGGHGAPATGAATHAPAATHPATATTAAAGASSSTSSAGVAVSVRRLPRSVHAGSTLKLRVRVTGGSGKLTARLTHGRATLAEAAHHHAKGALTVKLHLRRGARRGRAKLAVRVGDAHSVHRIRVTGPRRHAR